MEKLVTGETVSKYRLLEELGRGAMGEVYKAQDTFLGRFVALKLLAARYSDDREAILRFEREALATSSLIHPNICTIFESGQWRGRPFFAMELLEGVTLAELIRKGRMDVVRVVEIAIPVADALHAAHAIGVIHRDIKPANLFLTNRRQIKVLDFGLAKTRSRSAAVHLSENMATMATFHTLPGTVLGTLAYMAPEQVRAAKVDGRADLYSLGCVLYELLTGALPRLGATPIVTLPPELVEILRRMLAPDPSARYRTAAEVHKDLQEYSCMLKISSLRDR